MKDKKSKTIIFALSIVTLLVLSSVSSLGITTNSAKSDDANTLTTVSKSSIVCLKTSSHTIITSKTVSKNSNTGILGEPNDNASGNNVVANTTYDEYYPSIAVKGYNALVAYEFQNETGTNVYIRNSDDFGTNWSDEPIYWDLNVNVTSPSFTSLTAGSSNAFGAYITPENTSYVYEIDIPNIASPEGDGWTSAVWDYSSVPHPDTGEHMANFHNIQKPDVVNFPNSQIPWIISSVGDADFVEAHNEYDCEGTPLFFYQDPTNPSKNRIIVFFPEVRNCSNISVVLGKNDESQSMIYGVCEMYNGSNQDLLFFYGNPTIWGEVDELIKQEFNSPENLKHPKVYSKDNHIYIAAETDSNGIILYHSSNYGAPGSWSITNITADILPSGANPKNPVLYSNSTHLTCMFTYLGNLSRTNSSNNGLNWSEPLQINDQNGSVVDSFRFVDIDGSDHIVWTDNRDGNYDIYSTVGKPPAIDLEVEEGSIKLVSDMPFVFAKNRIEFSIRNNGDIYVKNVLVTVTYECEDADPVTIPYPACIGQLNGNTNHTYRKNLFRFTASGFINAMINFAGIQNLTVTIDPNGATGDTDLSNNAVTINADDGLTYESIFPRLYFLENLMKMLKPDAS